MPIIRNWTRQRVETLPASWDGAYLGERLPHIVFDPAIVAKTHEIIGQETNPLRRARKIFRWVSQNIPWNAEDEYCTDSIAGHQGLSSWPR